MELIFDEMLFDNAKRIWIDLEIKGVASVFIFKAIELTFYILVEHIDQRSHLIKIFFQVTDTVIEAFHIIFQAFTVVHVCFWYCKRIYTLVMMSIFINISWTRGRTIISLGTPRKENPF